MRLELRSTVGILLVIFCAIEFGVSASAFGDEAALQSSTLDFGRDIRPILSDHCFACHGPDEAARQSSLRLDEVASAYGIADSGLAAVVPNDLSASQLVVRIDATDADSIMPPPEANKRLTENQRELLRQWIASGAPYASHWSLVPPRRHSAPAVRSVEPLVDPIDAFIIAKIQSQGLTANETEQRDMLLRRVTFDLTGLPPTLQEREDFLADNSLEAFEKVVDRLLESPRFGEHLGRYWLDLVRYGDTHGLHLDNYREMWPYRDWVIKAINENMPFDQFIQEQLAGDLLPGATLDQQIASGFNRLNVTTSEGGSIYEEVFARNVIDRTDAFGTIFLGLTTGCAVCHDHKFDPLSQKDFYSLAAFFNSLDGRALDGNAKDHPPVVSVPTPESDAQLDDIARQLQEIQSEMNGPLPTVDEAQQRWLDRIRGEHSIAENTWVPLKPISAVSDSGTILEINDQGHITASGSLPDKNSITMEFPIPEGKSFQLLRLDLLTDSLEQPAGRSANGNAVLSELEVALKSPETGNEFLPVRLIYGEADHSQSDGPEFDVQFAIDGKTDGKSGWAIGGHQHPGPNHAWFVASTMLGSSTGPAVLRVTLQHQSQYSGHEFRRFACSLSENAPVASPDRQLQISDWHLVGPFEIENIGAGYYQGFASQSGAFDATASFPSGNGKLSWQLRDDFSAARTNSLPNFDDRSSVNVLHCQISADAPQKLTLLLGTEDGYQIWIQGKRVAELNQNRSLAPLADEITLDLQQGTNDLYVKVIQQDGPAAFAYAFRSPAVPLPRSVRELADKVADHDDGDAQAALRQYYRRVVSIDPDWLVLQDIAGGLRKQREAVLSKLPTTLVWRETDEPRVAHVLVRGQYDQLGPAVSRAVPQALPAMQESMPGNRLGLAQWLVDPAHPLTARVAVNRYWQQLFGTGLVKTSEDFGSQGTPPSHPKLLDNLALDFIQSDWNVKKLLKRLVMTEAYQRSAKTNDTAMQADPENRLLARGPRFRLDAETIRDAALFASGLLVEQRGGPSVKPPQPDGLWSAVAYTSSNTANFVADTGDQIFRRSVYTFWKRTSAPPQMTTFDAPSRERCTARRERTNTPMQALMLLNEPQYFAAARSLVGVCCKPEDASMHEPLVRMMLTVTTRQPSADELKELELLHQEIEMMYRDSPGLLESLKCTSAEDAAWLIVASTVLNLDAAINK